MNTLNLSGKIDNTSIALYSAIDKAARELKIPYVVVGASARDLVLHYGYGVRIIKATKDIDFGFQTPDWKTFDDLRSKLIDTGFEQTKIQHRLIYAGKKVDLVPFGPIQRKGASISWPPKGEIIMNVMGFQEALENTVNVIIQDSPQVQIPVVMPPGLSLLKIICWTDRDADLRNRDAKDLLYLMKSYETIPEIRKSIFDYPDIMEEFGWNIELGSAFKLGVDAGEIASEQTRNCLKRIENDEIEKRPIDLMVEDMCEDIAEEFEINRRLLNAYFYGFNSVEQSQR